MHILLGMLGGLVSLLYVLDRLGIDVGWFNPWSWRRRRAWAKKYDGDPIYSVDDPVQAAAILVAGVAKLDGDLSGEDKQAIRLLFEETFALSEKEASQLLTSAAHLLGAPQVIETQLKGLAGRIHASYSAEQSVSVLDMMERAAAFGGGPTPAQQDFLTQMRGLFGKPQPSGTWA